MVKPYTRPSLENHRVEFLREKEPALSQGLGRMTQWPTFASNSFRCKPPTLNPGSLLPSIQADQGKFTGAHSSCPLKLADDHRADGSPVVISTGWACSVPHCHPSWLPRAGCMGEPHRLRPEWPHGGEDGLAQQARARTGSEMGSPA